MKVRMSRKEFNLLRRGTGGGEFPNDRYDYSEQVGDGLSSSAIVAPALWVMRNFPEAPLAVEDAEGERDFRHAAIQLLNKPNPYYSGGALRAAAALDYTMRGNAYIEIDRGRGRRPQALYYQPSTQITPKGSDTELITHYIHATSKGQRPIEREDMIHIRYGLNPRDQKRGIYPLGSLLREIYSDDEAAAFTAAVLRNFGFPGLVLSPEKDTDDWGEETRSKIKEFFRRALRKENRGDVLVTSSTVRMNRMEADLSQLNLDKLRQIPEERVTAVLGIPAAVVGFGTGIQQTKVGATMKELRELAYENAIVPMQRVFADELTESLLREFDTNEQRRVVFDLGDVRVLQEDENQHSRRVISQYDAGLITRAEGRGALGREASEADEVYKQGVGTVLVPAQQQEQPGAQRSLPEWVQKALTKQGGAEQRQALNERFIEDAEELTRIATDEFVTHFREVADTLADAWLEEQTVLTSRNGHTKQEIEEQDRQVIDRVLLATGAAAPDLSAHYLRVFNRTIESVNAVMALGVELSEPMERAVLQAGGTRRGLIDMTEQTRRAMYQAVAQAREDGLGPNQISARLRDRIAAGPWNSVEVRGNVIGRTETKYAQNVSSMAAYSAAENVQAIQIFDAQLGDTDANCMEMNGRIVTVEEANQIAPIDHPRCTRSFSPVVGEQVEA